MKSSPDADIVLVPHTHWDREWYEPHEVFRLRLVHVLDDVLDRLDQDPEFRFTLDGQAMAIQDYLEIRPGSRARVERLVTDGRLAIGPFLILLDEFGCDGETIVRNLELGGTAAGRLGAVMQVGYLPDMFGHTAQMPQILRGFGIEHAALWRGVPDAVREHAFTWSAPDGSTVRTEYLFDGYGSALDMFAVPGRLAELSAQYRHRTRSWYGEEAVVGMLGTDHSAPAADLMERVREHNTQAPATGAPRIRVVTLGEHLLAGSTERASTAVVHGELRSHARGNLLPGVFSIRTNLKAEMAAAELALTRAERLDALFSDEDHRGSPTRTTAPSSTSPGSGSSRAAPTTPSPAAGSTRLPTRCPRAWLRRRTSAERSPSGSPVVWPPRCRPTRTSSSTPCRGRGPSRPRWS